MHTLAVQLAPVLAAEKSKTAFYIAGGLLVLWALTLSLGLGLRKPDFPGNLAGQRAVGAISAVLVLAAVSTAVITSGGGTQSAGAQAVSAQPTSSTAATPAPEATTTAPATPATSTAVKAPKATTGTPAPPSSPAATATSALKLEADPAGRLSFDVKQLSAKAGTVTIQMTNGSPIEHNVTVAEGAKVLGSTPTFSGGTKALTLKLKPGTYTFFCSVPGHRQAGMEGTLTVS